MTEVYYLNLWFLCFICTPGKGLRGKYQDTDRQMKPLFFKCHDSKTQCKEGGATTCTHSLQSLKQGLKLRASRVCSVICCKHGMKEAESKITRFVHLLKRKKSSVLKCLYLCCDSEHSKPPRQQYLVALLCTLAEPATALALSVSSHHHTVVHKRSFIARIRGKNWLHGLGCLLACSQCETAGSRALQLPATNWPLIPCTKIPTHHEGFLWWLFN